MTTIDTILHLIINSFVDSMKNRHLSGLDIYTYEPLEEICQFFNGEKLNAYGCFKFDLENKTIFVYNTYGDEDQPEHYDHMTETILSMGFCIFLDGFIYSFDIDPEGAILRLVKSKEKYAGNPSNFGGKRPFYFYRSEGYISMKTFDPVLNLPEHVAARDWTSGPRTHFDVEQFSIS